MDLGTFLKARVDRVPTATALLSGDRCLTFAELDGSSSRLAAWLFDRGLRPGDRIAVQWPNTIEVVQLYFAAFKAGLVVVPVNLRLKATETAWMLQHSAASLCFSAASLADAARQAGVPAVTELPVLEGTLGSQPAVEDRSPALLIYTSGSTGRPKGAILTHRNLVATASLSMIGYDQRGAVGWTPRALLLTPLVHSSGLYLLLGAMCAGRASVLLPAFDPAAALDAIEQHRCTLTLALPAMLQFMFEEQAQRPRDLRSLQVILAGGDSVSVALQQRIQALCGAVVIEGLAQSETGPSIVNPVELPRPGSIGVARDGVELRVVGADGEVVAAGDTGELLLRGPAVSSGYWSDPDATASAFRDGWFHTGDLVRCDRDGYYWFRGRLKEIIVRGGSNISPQEVEAALYTHPAVFEAGVVGLPDDVWGEAVIAAVALRHGMSATEAEIREHVRGMLADYKVPERVRFLAALPKGVTGKVHRRMLKEMVAHVAA